MRSLKTAETSRRPKMPFKKNNPGCNTPACTCELPPCNPIRCADCPTTAQGFHVLGYDVIVSGAPATIVLDFGPGPGNNPPQRIVTIQGLNALNGSYTIQRDTLCQQIPAATPFTLTTTFDDGTTVCVFEEKLLTSITGSGFDVQVDPVNYMGLEVVSGPCTDTNPPPWANNLYTGPTISFWFQPGNEFGGSGTFDWCSMAGLGSNPQNPVPASPAIGCTTAVEYESTVILGAQAPTIDYLDLRIRDYPDVITMDKIDNSGPNGLRYRTKLTGLSQVNRTYRNEYNTATCSFENPVFLFDVTEECTIYSYVGAANCTVPAGPAATSVSTVQVRVTIENEKVTIDQVGGSCTHGLPFATFDNGTECDQGTTFLDIPYQECVGSTLRNKFISARLTTTVALSAMQ